MKAFLAAAAALMLVPSFARAAEIPDLVKQLADDKTSQGALDELVAKKDAAVPALIGEAVEGHDLTSRGWAIVGLQRIGGPDAVKTLKKLTDDGKQPMLVRTWAVAARIDMAKSLEEAIELAPLAQTYPAAQRPLTLKVTALASNADVPVGKLIALTQSNYQLQQVLAAPITAVGPKALVDVMLHDKDMNIRQLAAAYCATAAQQQGKAGNEITGDSLDKALAFDPKASDVPWAGGPLYIPNIGWDKQFGTKLVGDLIAWDLWADKHGKAEYETQIQNNLNSITLAGTVGYEMNWNNTGVLTWLQVWGKLKGKSGLQKMLDDQGLAGDSRYKGVLDGMK